MLTPVAIVALMQAQVIGASGNHSVAFTDDGGLWVWGANFSGQLGLGDYDDRTSATPVPLDDVRGLAVGLAHTIVRRADGTSWVWGLNSFGQLGNAMQGVNSPTPVPVEL